MKLHLGCGQRHFEGYKNIDYPLSEHSVQKTSVADEHANLLELKYPSESIEEVRLHHVFEHFTRAQACALLSGWNSWLQPLGKLHIEVPDFERTARAVLRMFSNNKAQSVGLRHIFGSQEAHWAVHYEGYTKKRLKDFLEMYGFKTIEIKQEQYLDTYNIQIIGQKIKKLTRKECKAITEKYLSGFKVADVEGEQVLLDYWMNDFEVQLNKSFAANA